MDAQHHDTDRILQAMWLNWVAAYGAITLPPVVALFVPKLWIPFICLAEVYLLIAMMRSDISSGISSCSLPVRMASRILLLMAAAMFVVLILCTDWLVPTVIHLKLYNTELPFITSLILYPATVIICALTLFLPGAREACRANQRRNGYYAGDNIVATMYYSESKYQVLLIAVLAIILGCVEYWYYFTRYINTDMNAPDRFFFNYLPLLVYILSLFFMGGRYASMRTMYSDMESKMGHPNQSLVRFLIFCDEYLVLAHGDDGRWDTPAEKWIERCRSINQHQAQLILASKTEIHDAQLRYLFTNTGFVTGSNIIHYAVFIDSVENLPTDRHFQLFDAHMIDAAMAANAFSAVLANELFRIHTMTMAWKTYDSNGRRRYPIKEYRPTFRLADLRTWAIDFDDMTWFYIAHNNEDRHFFKTRALWHKITGIFRKS